MKKTIVFAGGGTAGHVMPNLALIDELSREYNCVYVGGDGMEKTLCLSRGIPFYSINTVKLRRDAVIKNLAVPFKLCACVSGAKRALEAIRPSLVFSKGGYAALPVVLAAKNIPVLSHESDFSPGLATKLCKNKSDKVLCAFEPCAERFKNGMYVGTPLRSALYKGKRSPAAYGLSGNKPILAVVGGSSGAAALNGAVESASDELLEFFDIIHVTGKNKSGGQKRNGYCTVEFESDMPRLYATCDVMLTRAGANALAECIALGVPTVAVPLEKASRGDQVQNAEYFGEQNAIAVLREANMTATSIVKAVRSAHANKPSLVAAMKKLDVDGTKKIVGIIKETIERGAAK